MYKDDEIPEVRVSDAATAAKQIRDLLATNWTKEAFVDVSGEETDASGNPVYNYCLLGAIGKVAYDDPDGVADPTDPHHPIVSTIVEMTEHAIMELYPEGCIGDCHCRDDDDGARYHPDGEECPTWVAKSVGSIPEWNDAHSRRVGHILAVMDRVIEKLAPTAKVTSTDRHAAYNAMKAMIEGSR